MIKIIQVATLLSLLIVVGVLVAHVGRPDRDLESLRSLSDNNTSRLGLLADNVSQLREEDKQAGLRIDMLVESYSIVRLALVELEERVKSLENLSQIPPEIATAEVPATLELPPTPEDLAEEATLEALISSTYPVLHYAELPDSVQATFSRWKNAALFVKFPPNPFGRVEYGCVHFEVLEQGLSRVQPLTPEQVELLQPLAENVYEEVAALEECLIQAIQAKKGWEFQNFEMARAFMDANFKDRPYWRVDPASGTTWVIRTEDVPCELHKELQKERNRIGAKLLKGKSGRFGAFWTSDGVPEHMR